MENKVKIYDATWLLCCTSVRLVFILAYKDNVIILNFQKRPKDAKTSA